jgi:hypothetical protein
VQGYVSFRVEHALACAVWLLAFLEHLKCPAQAKACATVEPNQHSDFLEATFALAKREVSWQAVGHGKQKRTTTRKEKTKETKTVIAAALICRRSTRFFVTTVATIPTSSRGGCVASGRTVRRPKPGMAASLVRFSGIESLFSRNN